MPPKHPITSKRLKTFVLLGHSNGEGMAPAFFMLEKYKNLYPVAYEYLSPQPDNYWKNIYVATSAQPYPGDAGTPQASAISDVEWLEMTLNLPSSPADHHPHPSPFHYPNTRGGCFPVWYYGAQLTTGDYLGSMCGVEIPFSAAWLHYWQEQVGVVKVAFPSSLFMRYDRGGQIAWINPTLATPASPNWVPGSINTDEYDFHAYWTPRDAFDWVPATDRLYARWVQKMRGAASALPGGSKIDVRCIILWLGDNDSKTQTREALELSFAKSAREMIRRIRKDCVDNDWTTLPAEQIVILWPGIHPYYQNEHTTTWDSVAFCNEKIREIADEDPYVRWFDTSKWTLMIDEHKSGIPCLPDAAHYGFQGYYQAATEFIQAFEEMEVEPFDAIAEEDRVKVSEVASRVRTYYNRARVQTDIDDATVLIHMNGALSRILNDAGDNAYWLRRRATLNVRPPNSVTTMPKYVSRVLKIESSDDPTKGLRFDLVGFANGGRCQIMLLEGYGGERVVHFITRPRDLTRDDELVPLPRSLVEWLVVETTRRLARSGSNLPLQASLEGEAADLRQRCLKELQVMQRARKDVLRQPPRKWPGGRPKTWIYRWDQG